MSYHEAIERFVIPRRAHLTYNFKVNEWCYYKHSYIKSSSVFLSYQGIAVNA